MQKLTILLLLPLLFAGCGTVPDDNTPQTETGFPVVIEDAFGKEVKIENPPERIVSIAPSQTEILFALDLGEKIVGVTNWCNHPEEAKTKTRVGDMHLDFETIVSLKPDLVVGIRSMQEDNLLRLEKLGLKVLAIEPKGIEGTLEAIETLGRATGKSTKAKEIIGEIQDQLGRIKAKTPKPKVLIVLDLDPLFTVGPGSLQHDLLELAGGENIASSTNNPWPQLAEEVVIEQNPDVILFTEAGLKERILAKPAWQNLKAVKSGAIYTVESDLISRPGPRMGLAAQKLAELMSK